jgi:hypothetical protein
MPSLNVSHDATSLASLPLRVASSSKNVMVPSPRLEHSEI